MNNDEDIPVLEDLVRPGIDSAPIGEPPSAEPEVSVVDNASELEEIGLDEEIRSILQRHMDAAYAEITQLLQQQKPVDNDQAD